ncbi:MAG: hypothetical protein ABRQ38_06440 [Candidatus Eremiobacterota bacterium]
MKDHETPALRTGDFEEERQKIIEEYKRGNYLKTIADYAMEEKKKEEKKKEEKGNNENKQSAS